MNHSARLDIFLQNASTEKLKRVILWRITYIGVVKPDQIMNSRRSTHVNGSGRTLLPTLIVSLLLMAIAGPTQAQGNRDDCLVARGLNASAPCVAGFECVEVPNSRSRCTRKCGAGCPDDYYCDSQTNYCMPQINFGRPCNQNEACYSGVCVLGVCSQRCEDFNDCPKFEGCRPVDGEFFCIPNEKSNLLYSKPEMPSEQPFGAGCSDVSQCAGSVRNVRCIMPPNKNGLCTSVCESINDCPAHADGCVSGGNSGEKVCDPSLDLSRLAKKIR